MCGQNISAHISTSRRWKQSSHCQPLPKTSTEKLTESPDNEKGANIPPPPQLFPRSCLIPLQTAVSIATSDGYRFLRTVPGHLKPPSSPLSLCPWCTATGFALAQHDNQPSLSPSSTTTSSLHCLTFAVVSVVSVVGHSALLHVS